MTQTFTLWAQAMMFQACLRGNNGHSRVATLRMLLSVEAPFRIPFLRCIRIESCLDL